jgi:hypothetical protein
MPPETYAEATANAKKIISRHSLERGVKPDSTDPRPVARRDSKGCFRRSLLVAAHPGEGRFTQPTAAARLLRPTQVGGLKIGSDNGTCFKIGV